MAALHAFLHRRVVLGAVVLSLLALGAGATAIAAQPTSAQTPPAPTAPADGGDAPADPGDATPDSKEGCDRDKGTGSADDASAARQSPRTRGATGNTVALRAPIR